LDIFYHALCYDGRRRGDGANPRLWISSITPSATTGVVVAMALIVPKDKAQISAFMCLNKCIVLPFLSFDSSKY